MSIGYPFMTPHSARRLFQAYVQLIVVGCAYFSALAETNVSSEVPNCINLNQATFARIISSTAV